MSNSLALLIPAYNAEGALEGVLETLTPFSLPILVANDGSSDRTEEIARSANPLKVLNHPQNRGKGAALLTGMKAAEELGFTHVLTLDADGQHPVESIPDFVDKCSEHPTAILVGDRFADRTIGHMPFVRRLSNGISSKLISWAARTTVPDAQCGMRVYPIKETLALNLESEGYALESEVLVKAGRRGIPVVNIPIACHYPEGTSTSGYRAFVDSWRIAKIVIRSLR